MLFIQSFIHSSDYKPSQNLATIVACIDMHIVVKMFNREHALLQRLIARVFAQIYLVMETNMIKSLEIAGYTVTSAVINNIAVRVNADGEPFIVADTDHGKGRLSIRNAETISADIRAKIGDNLSLFAKANTNARLATVFEKKLEIATAVDDLEKIASLAEMYNEKAVAARNARAAIANISTHTECYYCVRELAAGERRTSVRTGEEYGSPLQEDTRDVLIVLKTITPDDVQEQ